MEQYRAAQSPEIAAMVRRGQQLLGDRDWDRALALFDRILEQAPECAEAHAGLMLAKAKMRNFAEMGQILPTLFREEKPQWYIAAEPDTARIEAAARQYAVEGVYSPDEIRRDFAFDFRCPSRVEAAKENRRKMLRCFESDRDLAHALQYADPEFRERLNGMQASVLAVYDQRIAAAERDAEAARQDLIARYAVHLDDCERTVAEKQKIQTEKQRAAAEKKKKARKRFFTVLPLIIAAAAALIVAGIVFLPKIVKYGRAEELLAEGNKGAAAIMFYKAGSYRDARERSFEIWADAAQRDTISAGFAHTVGLKADGTVVAVGSNRSGQCDVKDWKDIVAVAAGDVHTVGLKSDGTVVAVGSNNSGQCDVSQWSDIVTIAAGGVHTVGLKADGTVVAVGANKYGQCNVSGWSDIVAVHAGCSHTVGLKTDGTVVAVGKNDDGQCDISGWTDIIAVAAGGNHTVGLKKDGTVIAEGNNGKNQCDVSWWKKIVTVSAGDNHTVGLHADGTVVAVGTINGNMRYNIYKWTDIVAVAAGGNHIVVLKSDGTVVAVGWNENGQRDVSGWKNIKLPEGAK